MRGVSLVGVSVGEGFAILAEGSGQTVTDEMDWIVGIRCDARKLIAGESGTDWRCCHTSDGRRIAGPESSNNR